MNSFVHVHKSPSFCIMLLTRICFILYSSMGQILSVFLSLMYHKRFNGFWQKMSENFTDWHIMERVTRHAMNFSRFTMLSLWMIQKRVKLDCLWPVSANHGETWLVDRNSYVAKVIIYFRIFKRFWLEMEYAGTEQRNQTQLLLIIKPSWRHFHLKSGA